MKDFRVVEPLLAVIRHGESYMRDFARLALRNIRDARAIELVASALQDLDRRVRWAAAVALGEIRDARGFEILVAALKDENKWVRGTAATALGKIGDARAVEPLAAALQDPEEVVRRQAEKALAQLEVPTSEEVPPNRPTVTALRMKAWDGQYFETPPAIETVGFCSDNACPCSNTRIPRGTGYIYVSQAVVDYRRDALSWEAVESKGERLARRLPGRLMVDSSRVGPILVCEQGAKLRNLDLEIAAADAKIWWETHLAPLRVTPLAGSKGAETERASRSA
jgi:hypothetical protein